MPDPLVAEQNASAPAYSATSDSPGAAPPLSPDPAGSEPAAAPSQPDGNTGKEGQPDHTSDAPQGEPEAPSRDQRQRAPETARERFSDMAAARKAAEQRADRLAESLERALTALDRVTARPVSPEVRTETAAAPPEPRPDRMNFDAPEAYDTALIEWSTKQATRLAQAEFERKASEDRQTSEREQAEQRQREQMARTQEQWSERRKQAIERLPDYVDVAERDDVPISTSMALIIQASEQGPEIAYHLGKHPDEAERIAAMVVPGQVFPPGHPAAGEPLPDVQRQLYELGRIAALATAPRPEVSRAPRPITPLGSNGAARQKTPAEMTTEEYAAWRMPQLQAERRPGMLGVPVGEVRRPQ